MMGGTLKFFASGNMASMKWIDVKKHNLGEFMALVQSHMNAPSTEARAAPDTSAEPDIAEQIKKLAELRDQGVLSEDEFDEKKTELLKRL